LRFATLHLHQVGGRLSLPGCHAMLGTPGMERAFGAFSCASSNLNLRGN
jgi:hypothetical protein